MENEVIQLNNEDRLLRRVIFKDPSYVRENMTVTSFAFKLRKGEEGLSVDIEKLTTYEKSITSVEKYRLFAVSSKDVRSLDLDCIHKPLPDNYAHAEISGPALNKNKVSSQLSKFAVYINYP
jgi:hypothetical protein